MMLGWTLYRVEYILHQFFYPPISLSFVYPLCCGQHVQIHCSWQVVLSWFRVPSSGKKRKRKQTADEEREADYEKKPRTAPLEQDHKERALLPIKTKDSVIQRKEKILKTGTCVSILFVQRYSWCTSYNSDHLTGMVVKNRDMVTTGQGRVMEFIIEHLTVFIQFTVKLSIVLIQLLHSFIFFC